MNGDVEMYTRTTLWTVKQFVNEEEIAFGSKIQKYACAYINITDDDDAKKYWEEGGRECVRTTMRRKRQAACNGMKQGFEGKLYMATLCFAANVTAADANTVFSKSLVPFSYKAGPRSSYP